MTDAVPEQPSSRGFSERASAGDGGREVADLPETQFQRTELAWRRTLVGLLAVAGLGSIHLLGGQHIRLGIFVGTLSVLAVVPIGVRIRRLRAGDARPMTWEPVALACAIVAFAAGIVVLE